MPIHGGERPDKLRDPVCRGGLGESAIKVRMKLLLCFLPLCLALQIAATRPSLAQSGPESGGHEIELWTGGGYSVPGGTARTGIFDLGLRYGWVLTDPHLPSLLRGRFEYAVDFEPAYLIFQSANTQPANTAYGWGFNPFALKWNFIRRGKLSPYLELSGGTLFTDHNVPAYTNTVNFTSAGALGTHVLGPKYSWSAEVRYLHISNAGLATPNPGINTVQVRLGVGKFWKK
jgi:lipid A 3-O-deacylase